MAVPKHFEIAHLGHQAWNKWRKDYPEECIDFSGVDFTSGENRYISFAKFEFGDRAIFRRATFGDGANFSEARFGDGADFLRARFGDSADFSRARFGDGADFSGARFGVSANFSAVTIGHEARFRDAKFGGGANFDAAQFGNWVTFFQATFGGGASFDGTTFYNHASFNSTIFEGTVGFRATQRQSEFGRPVNLSQSSDSAERDENSVISEIPTVRTDFCSYDFSFVQFFGPASFEDRNFRGIANFSNALFAQPPDFRGTELRENLDWTAVRFELNRHVKIGRLRIPVRGWTTDTETSTRLRRLRGVAKEIHAIDAERDLFILERLAERGVLWRNWWRGEWRRWLFDWWRPLSATFLMFLYRWSSDCGRSVILPLAWLIVWNSGLYYLYDYLIQRPLDGADKKALIDFTFASAVPFGATARPSFRSAIDELFTVADDKVVIPFAIQMVSSVQGIMNLVLLFLVGLALRNYFKFR